MIESFPGLSFVETHDTSSEINRQYYVLQLERLRPYIEQVREIGHKLPDSYPVMTLFQALRGGNDFNKSRSLQFEEYPLVETLYQTICSLSGEARDITIFKRNLMKGLRLMYYELHDLPSSEQNLGALRHLPFFVAGHEYFVGRYMMKAIFGDSTHDEL